MDTQKLAERVVDQIKKSITTLPRPTLAALKKALQREDGGAKVQLQAMLEAAEIGEENAVPICQDTGTPAFFIELGENFADIKQLGEIKRALRKSVRLATESVPLRPNTVHPFSERNPDDNTGESIPWIDWSLTQGSKLTLTYFPKGGGSTNMSQLKMMNPGEGLKGVKKIILKRIATMEGKPCPPTVVGVGLGGSAAMSLNLAKKALVRPVGDFHPEPQVAKLEEELKEKANRLGVGPMGVGGKTTVLDVKIEYEYRHPASFPVGITPQCWANRRATFQITPAGKIRELEE